MVRYFCHVDDDSGLSDTLGMELSSIAAAKCEALRYASRVICDDAERYWESGEFQMSVTDEMGLTLFSLGLTLTTVDAPAIRVSQKRT